MLTKADDRTFASVLADGRIHISCPDGTEGSVVRKYKTSDGKEGQKTELVYKDIAGIITSVAFQEGNFGNQIQITIADGDEKPICLCLSTSSNYGEDFLKKLPNIDLTKPVKLAPFAFADDKGKSKKGITITQHNGKEHVKLTNYYYDAEAKKNIHGYPEPKKLKKPLSKDQWKIYFAECREFLIEKTTELLKLDAEPKDFDKQVDEDFAPKD